jgi:hypothetical protein
VCQALLALAVRQAEYSAVLREQEEGPLCCDLCERLSLVPRRAAGEAARQCSTSPALVQQNVRSESVVHQCLTDDVLAAFVDNNLLAAERDVVILHISSCPKCFAKVTEALRNRADVPDLSKGDNHEP